MHICEECSKDYATASRLKNHVQRMHTKNKLNCNFCEYSTPRRNHFIEHVSYHIDPREKSTKRNGRNDFINYVDSLVCLTCPLCREDSVSMASLKAHYVLKHKAYRRFECDHCGWLSLTKENMISHITCKHVIKPTYDIYDKDRPHECTVKGCRKRYKVRSTLLQHLRTHSGRDSAFWILIH